MLSNGTPDVLTELQAIAAEALPPSIPAARSHHSPRAFLFNLDDAYRVTAAIRQMRETRGEMPVGRKIGFTNRTIWAEYNVYAPIWGYVYDRTVHNLAEIGGTFSLMGLAEPRIEPEIVFKLAFGASSGHGRDSIAGVHRLGWARFRNRAVDLSWMEVFRARHGRGVRPAWCPAYWASSSNRSARRGLEPDAFDLRNRSEARRHGRRSRAALRMCWGDPFPHCVISSIFSRAIRLIRHSQLARSSRRER